MVIICRTLVDASTLAELDGLNLMHAKSILNVYAVRVYCVKSTTNVECTFSEAKSPKPYLSRNQYVIKLPSLKQL